MGNSLAKTFYEPSALSDIGLYYQFINVSHQTHPSSHTGLSSANTKQGLRHETHTPSPRVGGVAWPQPKLRVKTSDHHLWGLGPWSKLLGNFLLREQQQHSQGFAFSQHPLDGHLTVQVHYINLVLSTTLLCATICLSVHQQLQLHMNHSTKRSILSDLNWLADFPSHKQVNDFHHQLLCQVSVVKRDHTMCVIKLLH